MLPLGLLVVHDSGRGGEDDVAELTRGQQLDNPLLDIGEADVVAGGDDTGLVEAIFRSFVSIMFTKKQEFRKHGETNRPFSWTTILPLRWLSTSSNSAM